MRGQVSLQEAMVAVSRRVETLRSEEKDKARKSPMSELEAFIRMDTTLAELHKEFQDVKRQHRDLVQANGADDPMVQIAEELEDSAWCAMQTRLLELRSQRILMRKAQRMMHDAKREEELHEEQAARRKMGNFAYQVAVVEQNRREKGMPGLLEWLIFYLWIQNQKAKLQHDFAKPAHLRVAAA